MYRLNRIYLSKRVGERRRQRNPHHSSPPHSTTNPTCTFWLRPRAIMSVGMMSEGGDTSRTSTDKAFCGLCKSAK